VGGWDCTAAGVAGGCEGVPGGAGGDRWCGEDGYVGGDDSGEDRVETSVGFVIRRLGAFIRRSGDGIGLDTCASNSESGSACADLVSRTARED
jgi:hypothetical protein